MTRRWSFVTLTPSLLHDLVQILEAAWEQEPEGYCLCLLDGGFTVVSVGEYGHGSIICDFMPIRTNCTCITLGSISESILVAQHWDGNTTTTNVVSTRLK